MEEKVARERLLAERADVAQLLRDAKAAAAANREVEVQPGDYADSAQPLTAQGMDEAMAASFQNRLDAINRALKRLDEGTYGRSIRSGTPIPDARLEADPTAELTIEEARQAG
jgi:DnaK suppressor protein